MAERSSRTNMNFFLHLIVIICGLAVFTHAFTDINLSSEDPSEELTSPNYPNDYGILVHRIWKVIAPRGFRVMVHFDVFDLHPMDTLIVFHASKNSWGYKEKLASLSGSSLPDNISSIGSYLWLRFDTLTVAGRKGFSLVVSAVEMVINLSSVKPREEITSPNYPNDYDNNNDMIWEVIAPKGFRVMVQFSGFRLAWADSFKVYHGLTNSFEDAKQITCLPGSVLYPDNISSIGSYLWLRFTTDGFGKEKGFSLLVSLVETVIINLTNEEPNENLTSPNYPAAYGDNVDIIWEVIAPTGFRVKVQFTYFWVEWRFDLLRVYYGLTNSFQDATETAILSGFSLPDDISSIGSYLWLWFTSNRERNVKGFSLTVSAVKTESKDNSPTILGTDAEASTVTPVAAESNIAENTQGGPNSAVTSLSVVVPIVIILVTIALFA